MIVSPDGIEFSDLFETFSEVYTVEGWYTIFTVNRNKIGEFYLKNGDRLGWTTESSYYFIPTDKLVSSKQEFQRHINLLAFL